MPAIIKLYDLVGVVINPEPMHYAFPCYVKSYDPDAFDGSGDVVATNDIEAALRFADKAAAFDRIMRPSKTRPRRPDGKPNRPIMVFTMEIIEV